MIICINVRQSVTCVGTLVVSPERAEEGEIVGMGEVVGEMEQ